MSRRQSSVGVDRKHWRSHAVWLLFVLVAVSVNVGVSAGMGEGIPGSGKPNRFCGKALNNILDRVCLKGFSSRIKRCCATQTSQDVLLQQQAISGVTNTEQQQPMAVIEQRMKRKRRIRRLGIVHECCRNGCVYADIVKYCL